MKSGKWKTLYAILFAMAFFPPVVGAQYPPLNYPEATIYDASGDQSVAEYDIVSVQLRQISDDIVQIKVTLRGNPNDLLNTNYNMPQIRVRIDADNSPSTGIYRARWNLGEEFMVRIGFEYYRNDRLNAIVCSDQAGGDIEEVPVMVYGNSFYAHFSLKSYKPYYTVGSSLKFAAEFINTPGQNDGTASAGVLVLGSSIMDPGFKITTPNEIFSEDPHSMYLTYGQSPSTLSVTAEDGAYQDGLDQAVYFSPKPLIAEIINGNQVKTNFDVTRESTNSDYSLITAFLPQYDLMVPDSVKVLSGTTLLKSGRAAFIMPDTFTKSDGTTKQIGQILSQYDAARISSYAFDIEEYVVGQEPINGYNRMFAFNYPAYGWSGNPVWIGIDGVYDNGGPIWWVLYHEAGHEFLPHIFSYKFPGLLNYMWNGSAVFDWNRYGEGWATLIGTYAMRALYLYAQQYNIPDAIKTSIKNCFDDRKRYYRNQLNQYVNSGANFQQLCADYMDGMFIVLAEERPDLNPWGWELYPRFYHIFLPEMWDLYQTVMPGYGETFFIAALSAAAGHDLRPLFASWNFPINDAYYDEIMPVFTDVDGDGYIDAIDVCPNVYNPRQLDADNDGIGDLCDPTPGCGGSGQPACEISNDRDGDGIPDAVDNCLNIYNPSQSDADGDGIGDACSPNITNFTYTVANNTVTITGYTGTDGNVVIPATINGMAVVSIGDNAFSNNTSVTSVTFATPSSVTSIGYGAFSSCTGLTSVTIPDGVTRIDMYAFAHCTGLTSITIPASVTSLWGYAFGWCTNLVAAYFNGNAPSMDINVFYDNASGFTVYYTTGATGFTNPWNGYPTLLFTPVSQFAYTATNNTVTITGYTGTGAAVVIPDTIGGMPVIGIGNDAFSNNTSLNTITIPGTVTSIGSNAFSGCTALTSVTIPASVTSIGAGAFNGCTSLTAAYFYGNAPAMGTNGWYFVFDNCASGFTVYYCPGATGFSNPWYGYTTAVGGASCPTTTTTTVCSSNTYYRDADGDTYGNASVTTQACTQPTGYAANSTDCNDNNSSVHPAATEVCNGIDDNCNGQTDEGLALYTYYRDSDSDTYGNPAVTIRTCAATAPSGYVANSTDCNDGDTTKWHNLTGYVDADHDGYGTGAVQSVCSGASLPAGYAANNTDCNDGNLAVHPGATEVCNGIDDNCNGQTDEGVKITYYRDSDIDGYGNASVTTLACTAPGGYVANSTDCNDSNKTVNPGATEVCNGIDDNCNGQTDEGVKTTYYRDSDGDTYGNASVTTQACSVPNGYVANSTDCNDSNKSVKPGATEVCGDGIDNNCNGSMLDGCDVSGVLKANWRFNETSGTTASDSSGNGVTATLKNGPVWYYGTLKFDGINDYVDATTGTFGITTNNEYTVSFWVGTSNLSKTPQILVQRDASAYPFSTTITNSKVTGTFRIGTATYTLTSSASLANNQTYHVVLTYKSGSQVLYVNGGQPVSNNKTGTPNVAAGKSTTIGKTAIASSPPTVYLDDVRIYNKALSAAEVSALYDGGNGRK